MRFLVSEVSLYSSRVTGIIASRVTGVIGAIPALNESRQEVGQFYPIVVTAKNEHGFRVEILAN